MLNFEDNIKRNKSYFDKHEPDVGHSERFINKLDQADLSKRDTFQFKLVYKIAAGVAFLFIAGFFLIYLLNTSQKSSEVFVNSIEYSQDLNDILAYYDAVSLEKVNEIDNLVTDSDKAEALKKTALNRLEDIDGGLASIEKEFAKNPEDENIKSALINNKRKKVEVMDNILIQLDFANTSLF